MKSIYDLELHEGMYVDSCSSIYVRRVPGGWVYDGNNACFVPYNEEFKNSELSK